MPGAAKFKEVVDDILGSDIELPGPLAKHAAMELLSEDLDNDFEALKAVLRQFNQRNFYLRANLMVRERWMSSHSPFLLP